MSQRTRGEYLKYYVRRHDGRDKKGGDRQNADYFVLDLTYDKYAMIGLLAYAKSCEAEYPLLAADLYKKIYHPEYPFIYKACFAVSLDNGGLNRDRPEGDIKTDYHQFINEAGLALMDLQAINDWFKYLSDEEMGIATAGEETEMEELFKDAPQGAYALLNLWFDGPC